MKKFLVIGNPIEHSLSPELHNYWIKNSGVNAIYEKKKINEGQLEQIISQVKNNKIKGINVTVPFKKTVIPYLDELSAEAQSTQSVNTIYKQDDRIIGHNTDIFGFETSIKKEISYAKKTFQKYKWPSIDVTRKSVEETAASIIKIHEIYLFVPDRKKRNFKCNFS